MSRNKQVLGSLKKIGIRVDGADVEVEVEEPPTAVSEDVQFLQQQHDALAARFGADTPGAKALLKQLEAARGKIGQTAQSKAAKDLAAADYQLNLHEDSVLKEQAAARQSDEEELAELQKAVDAKKEAMAQRHVTNQESLEQIKMIRMQIATSRKLLPAQAEKEDQHPGGTEAPQMPAMPQPLVDAVGMMQALLESLKNIPNAPSVAQEQMQALQSTLDTQVKPLITSASSSTPPSNFGPAVQTKPSTSVTVHPYATPEKDKNIVWGDGVGDDA